MLHLSFQNKVFQFTESRPFLWRLKFVIGDLIVFHLYYTRINTVIGRDIKNIFPVDINILNIAIYLSLDNGSRQIFR
jgi:hypothetical protein